MLAKRFSCVWGSLLALASLLVTHSALADGGYVYLTKWSTSGSPTGVAVDAGSNVYVADWSNNRIQKFTSTGTFVTTWGTSGYYAGQFQGPAGVAVDAGGNVYVADTHNHRVQKFTNNGTY